MSESKAATVVPDEPEPPSQRLLGYQQQQHALPCMQTLEQLILNDAWTARSDAKFDVSTTPSNNSIDDSSVSSFTEVVSTKINVAPQLDDLTQSILTGCSLKGYVRLLNIDHARAVCDRLYNETDGALRKMCDYGDGAVRFDDDPYDACIKIARLAVSRRVASNNQQAQRDASDQNPPSTEREYVAYLSPCVPYPDLAKAITSETCIQAVHTVSAVRSSSRNGDSTNGSGSAVDGRLDVDALEESLKADIETKRQVVLVVAVIGSSIFGHNDLVTKLLLLRQTYGFWLHLVGLNAAALATSKPPEQLMRVMKAADSVTLPLGRWLGLKVLPIITYVRIADYVSSLYQREKLDSLPWWIVMNYLNIEGIRKRIDVAFRTSSGVLKHLLSHPRFFLPGLGSATDMLARIEKGTVMPPTVLTFKYTITRPVTNADTGEVADEIVHDEYVDCLNVWLAQGLSTDCPSLGLQLVDLTYCSLGAGIRYCPIEQQASTLANPSEYVQTFGERLRSMASILDATIRAKDRLETVLVGKHPELQLVRIKKWAGVGGLVYLPAMFRPASQDNPSSEHENDSASAGGEWNDEQRRQISHFNIELVHKLRGSDGAFSVGESLEGLSCVKFGMLADDQDLEDLVELVVKVGHEIEESSQYVDALADMVRRGIEAANEGLRKENDERLMQEGVLRQVPIFSSLLNWWSPLPKEASARGRTFDLKTGRILSTAELLAKVQTSQTVSPSLTPHLSASEASRISNVSEDPSQKLESTEAT